MLPLIVTAAIIRQQDTVLLTRRPQHTRHGGLWEFPGGKLDPDESPEEGLRREIREEIAIEIEVGKVYDVVYFRYDRGPVLVLAYECLPLSGDIRHIEVDDHQWVPLHKLKDFDILPADRSIIEKLHSEAII